MKLLYKPNDKALKDTLFRKFLIEFCNFRYGARAWYQLITKGVVFLPGK